MERNMTKNNGRKIFINLAVRDLPRAKAGPEAYMASQQK
jgi:hypothetical protein